MDISSIVNEGANTLFSFFKWLVKKTKATKKHLKEVKAKKVKKQICYAR